MVPAPLTVRCCLRSSRGPALPLDWYEGGGRWMRIRRKRVAGEGGPIMSRSRVRIGFAALTCSPTRTTRRSPCVREVRRPLFLALSLLVAMALGFASSPARPIPCQSRVSGPIRAESTAIPWNHSLFALAAGLRLHGAGVLSSAGWPLISRPASKRPTRAGCSFRLPRKPR